MHLSCLNSSWCFQRQDHILLDFHFIKGDFSSSFLCFRPTVELRDSDPRIRTEEPSSAGIRPTWTPLRLCCKTVLLKKLSNRTSIQRALNSRINRESIYAFSASVMSLSRETRRSAEKGMYVHVYGSDLLLFLIYLPTTLDGTAPRFLYRST